MTAEVLGAYIILGVLGAMLLITGVVWKNSKSDEWHLDEKHNWIHAPQLPDWYAKHSNWPLALGATCFLPVIFKLFKLAILG